MNPTYSLIDKSIAIIIVLFVLSLVSERFITWFKLYFFKKGNVLFWIFFNWDKDYSTKSDNPVLEKERERRILLLNIILSIMIAILANANLFKILQDSSPFDALGWKSNEWEGVKYIELSILKSFSGCILGGLFISLGSKFWHDVLDMLFYAKNLKSKLSDPATYKIDNIIDFDKLFNIYQPDFIKAAYLEAKTKYMAIENVKAICIKSNESGYYFEITVNKKNIFIENYYQYILDDGTPYNIPLKLAVLAEDDRILAHNIDLSAKIFDVSQPENWGTLGVFVRPLDENSTKKYLLTCCHNVVKPIRKIPAENTVAIKVGTYEDNSELRIGTVFKAERDYEMDAALIEIDEDRVQIINSVPKMGNPQKPRQLFNSDAGNVEAFIFGAKSGIEKGAISKGMVTSIYNSVKITYSDDEFTIINTIAISNNGKAVSQGGDSGACVLDSDNNVLGLVVAGSYRTTYILPINTLLAKLNVQLI